MATYYKESNYIKDQIKNRLNEILTSQDYEEMDIETKKHVVFSLNILYTDMCFNSMTKRAYSYIVKEINIGADNSLNSITSTSTMIDTPNKLIAAFNDEGKILSFYRVLGLASYFGINQYLTIDNWYFIFTNMTNINEYDYGKIIS